MAQRAASLGKRSAPVKIRRGGPQMRVVDEEEAEPREIPLDLHPLLAPYKKRGRFSLRVERMSPLGRLSRGRNNGDGSWSLASDELDDLFYLLPETVKPHTIAIRIVALQGGDATTLALLDLHVAHGEIPVPAKPAEEKPAAKAVDDGQLQKLREQIAAAKADLAMTETKAAQERAALAAGFEQRMAAVEMQAAQQLQKLRDAREAEHSFRFLQSEERAQARLDEAREHWQRENKEALQKAEAAWRAAEASRLTAVEAEWRQKSVAALAEATARSEAARGESGGELRGLKDECAKLQASVTLREVELTQFRAAMEKARETWQRDAEQVLAKASAEWTRDSAARIAAIEAEWQQKSAKAVADALSQSATARDKSNAAEQAELHEKLAALETQLSGSDAALSQAQRDGTLARERGQQEREQALAKAGAEWKAETAARIAAVEAEWQQKSAKAVADALSQSATARDKWNAAEQGKLPEKLAALEANLVQRDAALAQTKHDATQAREAGQRDAQQVLTKASAEWKAETAARIAAIEAEWQQKSAKAVAEALSQSATARDKANAAEQAKLHEKLVALEAGLAQRDAALAQTELDVRQARERWQQEMRDALAKAEAEWKTAEATRLTAAESQWRKISDDALAQARAQSTQSLSERDQANATEQAKLREQLRVLGKKLSERDAAMVQVEAQGKTAREQWQEESRATLANAETAWKSAEAQRLATAQSQWQAQSAKAVAEARSETAGARDRANAIERNNLREQLAALEKKLAERNATFSQLEIDTAQAREYLAQDARDALVSAEKAWQTAEVNRVAALESQWQEKSARALAEARLQAATVAATTRNQADAELRLSREETKRAEAALAARESELRLARAEMDIARQTSRRDSETALSATKSEAAARFAEAQTQWQIASAKALSEANAARQQAEASFAAARAKAEDVSILREQMTADLNRVHEESTALKAALAAREAELEKTRKDSAQAQRSLKQEADKDLAAAKAAWKTESNGRLADAKAEWKKQSVAMLADATARAESAEAALSHMRRGAAQRSGSDDIEVRRLEEELAALRLTLASYESDLAKYRAGERPNDSAPQTGKIMLRTNQSWEAKDEPGQRPRRRIPFRDVIIAGGLAAAAIAFYPRVEPMLPQNLRSHISAIAAPIGSMLAEHRPQAEVAGTNPDPAAGLHRAVVVKDANVRTGPSTSAAVISTLPKGREVATVEQRGNWMLVELEAAESQNGQRQGWVYSTFLEGPNTGEVKSPAAKGD